MLASTEYKRDSHRSRLKMILDGLSHCQIQSVSQFKLLTLQSFGTQVFYKDLSIAAGRRNRFTLFPFGISTI